MERKKRSVIWKPSKEDFEKIVQESNTISEILKHFGLENKGSNYRTVKRRLQYDNLDFSHIPLGMGSNKGRPKGGHKHRPLNSLLIKNYPYSPTNFRKRMLAAGILGNKCHECGIQSIWNNKPLQLQLDHKNGISNDNRIENLRILCPNCHSQTPTFSGRSIKQKSPKKQCLECPALLSPNNKHGLCKKCLAGKPKIQYRKVIDRPSQKEIATMRKNMSWDKIGKLYGVSGAAVRKWNSN